MCDESKTPVYLEVVVKPKARCHEIGEWLGDSLKVSVTAAPEDGRANDAVIDLISAALGISKSSVSIVRGRSSRRKLLRLVGIKPERLRQLGRRSG